MKEAKISLSHQTMLMWVEKNWVKSIERSLEEGTHSLQLSALGMDGNNDAKDAPQPNSLLEALMQNVANTTEEMASFVWVKRTQLIQKIYAKP